MVLPQHTREQIQSSSGQRTQAAHHPDPCISVLGCRQRAGPLEPRNPCALSSPGQTSRIQTPRGGAVCSLSSACRRQPSPRGLPPLVCILITSAYKNNVILTSSPLERPDLQIRSLFEALEVRLEHVNRGDTVQPSAPRGSSCCPCLVSGRVCEGTPARWNPGPRACWARAAQPHPSAVGWLSLKVSRLGWPEGG